MIVHNIHRFPFAFQPIHSAECSRLRYFVGNTALSAVIAILMLSPIVMASPPAPQFREPEVPALSAQDCEYLTWVARQVLEHPDQKPEEQKPTYVPTTLAGKAGSVLVTLREDGYHRGMGIAGPGDLVPTCEQATRLALGRVRNKIPGTPEQLARMSIEIEVTGEDVPLPFSGGELLSRDIPTIIEPGVHGIVLSYQGKTRRLCPSETIVYNKPIELSCQDLGELLCPHPEDLKDLYVGRFRTQHWVELEPGKGIYPLHRGLSLIKPDDVTRTSIDQAIQRMGDYLVYRQQPQGLFACEYLPSESKFSEYENLIYQAGATWALSTWAKRSGDPKGKLAALKAIRWFAKRITPIPGVEGASFIAGEPKKHKLGVTALICLAMYDAPDSEQWRDEREKLIKGILWLQQDEGRFLTAFPPSETLPTQEKNPGLALLALSRAYEEEPRQEIMAAFDKALKFYQNYFDKNPDPDFVPRQIQAFSRMAVYSKREDFVHYVFTMADALAAGQLTKDNWPWSDTWGAIVPGSPHGASSATGLYADALCDARKLALVLSDKKRAEKYASVVKQATRFLMQLEFHPEECWYVRRNEPLAGGVRKSLWDSTVRLNSCEYTLMGLMKAERLFRER